MSPTNEKRIEELYALVEKIELAMMTTRRRDGRLVSRPMATQKRRAFADLWFVTDIDSDKLDELKDDANVNLAYLDTGSFEWVSVSGTATISSDRARIREVWEPDWRAWFGKVDDVRDGGPDDPRLALILVDVESVVYLKQDRPRPVVLFEVVKGMVTGDKPDTAEPKRVEM